MDDQHQRTQDLRAQAEKDADPRIDLAVERTALALERTHLAWVRTVMGLITSGFVIDKGVDALHQARLATGEAWMQSGHLAGLVLTGTGTLLMLLATVLYVKRSAELARAKRGKRSVLAPDFILSVVIIGIGCLLMWFMTVG